MRIIHTITNIFSSKLEFIDSERMDEFYNENNKLYKLFSYDKDDTLVVKTVLTSESNGSYIYDNYVLDGDEKYLTYEEMKWNEDKTVFTNRTFNQDRTIDFEDTCYYSDNKLIKQILIVGDLKNEIKHFYNEDGQISLIEEFRNDKKEIITVYLYEDNITTVTNYCEQGVLGKKQMVYDKKGRLILQNDFNGDNQKTSVAKFSYDKSVKKILEDVTGGKGSNYIKRIFRYGDYNEGTIVENIYKF